MDDAPCPPGDGERRRRYGASMRRLLPHPADPVDLAEAYAEPARRRVDGRPWLLVNMIASLDGAVALGERSGGLGGPADQRVFAHLRQLADVIVVGAGTARAERYGPPRQPGQRIAVVTRRANLDWSTPLFSSGAGFVITTVEAPDVPVDAIRAGHDQVDLAAALTQLQGDIALCEGGPTLNGDLLAADLIDEWCLTVAPLLAGGGAGRAAVSPTEHPSSFALAQLLEEDGFLFLRALRSR
jgi:riboflavin biosynthesis pyrimidine reductase